MAETASDKITLSKAVSGIGAPKNFVKIIIMGLNIGIIALIIIGGLKIWSMLFPKKATNTQNQTSSFVVESGATVENLTVTSNQKQTENKKVGLELEASSHDAGLIFKKYINDSWHVGIGARFDYNKPDDDNELQVKPVVRVGVDFY